MIFDDFLPRLLFQQPRLAQALFKKKQNFARKARILCFFFLKKVKSLKLLLRPFNFCASREVREKTRKNFGKYFLNGA